MKKYIIVIALILCELGIAQALPANRYYPNKSILDLTNSPPSFAYSLRKLKKSYTGFAVLIRRATDNAEANILFDTNGIVSPTSVATVTTVGTSGFTVGQTMSYATFIASQVISVTTWYDQGVNAYHATQPLAAAQPIIQLNTAGSTNTLPSIIFNGNRNLVVNQPIQNLALNGINGTFMIVTKPTSNQNQLSFGTSNGTDGVLRWNMHMNWSDGYLYFDSGEGCCAASRSILNNTRINIYNQYTFIRGTTYKSILINSATTTLNNAPAASIALSGSVFGIGNWDARTTNEGFQGNISEVIMFPKDYSQFSIKFLETNQINFWLL